MTTRSRPSAVFLACAACLAACQTVSRTGPTPTPLLAATLHHGWDGEAVAGAPTISLAIEGDRLVLRGSRRAPADLLASDRSGAFMQGLWERDCTEAFLLNPDTGAYLELNLSPSGAWWACLFRKKLDRITPDGLRLAGATGTGHVETGSWTTELRIPLSSLPPELAFAPGRTRANLCFCLGHGPQHYLTLRDLGHGRPDFHQPERWGTLPAK